MGVKRSVVESTRSKSLYTCMILEVDHQICFDKTVFLLLILGLVRLSKGQKSHLGLELGQKMALKGLEMKNCQHMGVRWSVQIFIYNQDSRPQKKNLYIKLCF